MLTWLLRFIIKIFSFLPEGTALELGRGMGWMFGRVFRYHRADAFDALERAFPEWSDAQRVECVNQMYSNLGMSVVETMRAGQVDESVVRERVKLSDEDRAKIQGILDEGKGLLVLTAHIGNWEMLNAVYVHLGTMCSIITKEMKSTALQEVLTDIRRRSGGQVLSRNNAYRPSVKALKNNEIVAFVIDQNMIRDEGVFVDFLGKPACTSPGLAHISAATGVPVLPIFTVRDRPGWYTLRVGEKIDAPRDRSEEILQQFTQIYSDIVEKMIREVPDQWIWIHRRWRTKKLPHESEK